MEMEIQGGEKLKNFISEYVAPTHVRSEIFQVEQSKAFLKIMHKYNISSRTTDPHQPQQNPAENHIQLYDKGTNTILYLTGAPSYFWMYSLLFWVSISFFLAKPSHGNCSFREILFGTTTCISHFMHYTFWYLVYYYYTEENFPSMKEQRGLWFGPTHYYGYSLTYWILTDSKTVLFQSTI